MSGPVVFGLRLLLTVSLYGFLGWAFVVLWRDLKLQSALLATRKVPPISLTVRSAASDPLVRRFIQAEVTIGRDPACECLVEGDEAISARHARLSYHHGQWWLEDLGSTNGVLLNAEKLAIPTVVISGDEFSCGGTHFIIALTTDLLIPRDGEN
ncbi:MAG TPA: FHA domain-containing protein [Anaerolineales bacterium]|nr:FHA domain-containing protein [Anaerolineales bacterium]